MGGGRGMITAGPPGELSAGCGGLYIGTGPASPGGAPYCGGRGSAPIICAASAGLVLASAAMAGCIAAPPAMPGGPGSAPPARLGGPGSAGWEWSIQAPPSAVVNCSSLTYLATTWRAADSHSIGRLTQRSMLPDTPKLHFGFVHDY